MLVHVVWTSSKLFIACSDRGVQLITDAFMLAMLKGCWVALESGSRRTSRQDSVQ
jgi:hypothetical protein